MENNNFEKVFLKNGNFKVTNKSVMHTEVHDLSKDEVEAWDANTIEDIKEVVGKNFSNMRALFWFTVISCVIFSNDVIYANELHLIGMSNAYSWLVVSFGIAGLMSVIHQSVIKPMRYLSIKLKNGVEKKIQTPFDSLVDVEKSWSEAVAFGIMENDSTESPSLRRADVSKDSFSIEEAVEETYITDALMKNGRNSKWRSFKLSSVKKITDGAVVKSWFSDQGLVVMLLGGMMAGFFFKYVPVVNMESMAVFVPIMAVVMVVVKRLVAMEERKITIELDGNEALEVDGDYNWSGDSKVKMAINKAMHTN